MYEISIEQKIENIQTYYLYYSNKTKNSFYTYDNLIEHIGGDGFIINGTNFVVYYDKYWHEKYEDRSIFELTSCHGVFLSQFFKIDRNKTRLTFSYNHPFSDVIFMYLAELENISALEITREKARIAIAKKILS